MLHVTGDDAAGVVERPERRDADALAFDRAVIPFDLAVALGIVRRRFHVRHAGDTDELFEIARHKLWAVVGDDPRVGSGIFFACSLQDHFDVDLLHLLADFPVHDRAAATIQHAAHKVKRAADIEVADVHVPVLMRPGGLMKTGSFLRRFAVPAVHHAGRLEDTIDGRGADSYDVGIQHHEGQAAITFQRILPVEVENRFFFPIFQPPVARHQRVVFVDFSITFFPVVKLAATDAQPVDDRARRNLGSLRPVVDVIDDLVPRVVGNPNSL